ncbi:MAG: methyltransferase domain-containing protein [Actinomycetota bacterium]|nr:methyltransferase domain-containing protein [Actinomycetota bacterium]
MSTCCCLNTGTPRTPGYSKEMIAGRRDFFDAGHYQILADGVADVMISYLPGEAERVVVDAGCGEGYYLRRLRARLGEQGPDASTVLGGIDISKHAIRVAAKRDPRGLYAVAGTHHVPVLPDRVDVLLTHFSPVSAADFAGSSGPVVWCSSVVPASTTCTVSRSCSTTRRPSTSRHPHSPTSPASN